MEKVKENEVQPDGIVIRFHGIAYRFWDYEKFMKMIEKKADEIHATTWADGIGVM